MRKQTYATYVFTTDDQPRLGNERLNFNIILGFTIFVHIVTIATDTIRNEHLLTYVTGKVLSTTLVAKAVIKNSRFCVSLLPKKE